MIVYVQRDAGGGIIGVFANPQSYAQEAIDDSDPSVQAVVNPSAAALEAQNQAAAVGVFADRSPASRVQRAAALVVLDRVNELREWLTAFKAAVAAATSLANLQTRVAALPNTPDYTAAQIKAAVQSKSNSTDSD